MVVIALSSTLNFLDRQILAALAPQLMREFQITAAGYGDVIFAFSICYALAAPLAGLFIDRAGIRAGPAIAVALWSLAGIATGLTATFAALVASRSALGVFEAAGIPGTGKASAVYLKPKERAFGASISQMGLTLGALLAPVMAEFLSERYGWRSAFLVAGALGFVWIPVWLAVSRNAPQAGAGPAHEAFSSRGILRDSRYWAILVSNVLMMFAYSLWVNWTTVFLVRVHGISQQAANYQLAWIPPIFATAGGFAGSWLTLRWARGAADVTPARLRAIRTGAVLLLATAAVPLLPGAGLATAAICLSFFGCVVASVNIYSLPLDLFGARAAAFAVGGLTSVYGLLQGFFSSAVGRVVDRHGFVPVCVVVALCPLASWLVLHFALRRK
jgi:ACS family hexuronate transporter-like MFS transporter